MNRVLPRKAWAGYLLNGRFRRKIRHQPMGKTARLRFLRQSLAQEPRQALFLAGDWKWLSSLWIRT